MFGSDLSATGCDFLEAQARGHAFRRSVNTRYGSTTQRPETQVEPPRQVSESSQATRSQRSLELQPNAGSGQLPSTQAEIRHTLVRVQF